MKQGHWTEDETEFLKANFGKLTNKDIGEQLERKVPAVTLKARKLGLTGDDETLEEDAPIGDDEVYALQRCAMVLKDLYRPAVKRIMVYLTARFDTE